MNHKIPSDHTIIHDARPRSSKNLSSICSKAQPLSLVLNPTRRYLRKLSLNYLHCPDCESKNITFYGKSSSETQRHLCKDCSYQFVAQFDAIFPKSKRRWIFEEEFLSNLKTIGFKEGCGRQVYWSGAMIETLQMLESNTIKIRFNRLLKTMPIQGDKDYRVLLEFIIGEAYSRVVE